MADEKVKVETTSEGGVKITMPISQVELTKEDMKVND